MDRIPGHLPVCSFPVLMYWNSERIDMLVIAGLIAMPLAGAWSYLYVTRYELTLDEGFSVQRLWREPFSVAWREIAIVRSPLLAKEVSFETADRRRIKISVFFPGLTPLLDTARQKLPEASFSRRTS
ncbi:MAG TPA: hypothetical protein VN380_01460 [Thermoanaerobaculia bacterium]|nr:hypothetical protein [Thermoanaerobaculia bacterium]